MKSLLQPKLQRFSVTAAGVFIALSLSLGVVAAGSGCTRPQPLPAQARVPPPEGSAPTPAPEVPPGALPPGQPETPAPGTPSPPGPGWREVHREGFSHPLPAGAWYPDPVPDDGPFADAGVYFTQRGIFPPAAVRATVPFGTAGWLTLESYSRDGARDLSRHAAVVSDPADPSNQVLRIGSPAHTDATVVRPSSPLPENYRVSLRLGFAEFGDGKPGLNGYDDGGETAEPWLPQEQAASQNGFYWLAILDAVPRPHNNVWIHHHRKVVIDSDSHTPAWMEIWDGEQFVSSGERPVMMFALDGRGGGWETSGKPFMAHAAGEWQPAGAIRAADGYLPGEWYTASIERKDGVFTLEISGRFRFGGQRTYRASIDAAQNCVWHFNRPGESAPEGCIDDGGWPSLNAQQHPNWPEGGGWPDYFMFGDPHSNFYEGQVLYDDVVLEVWDGAS